MPKDATTKDQLDGLYAERNLCVAALANMAQQLGYKTWIRLDTTGEVGYQHILFIQLPTGQVSWHLKDDELANFPNVELSNQISYDGHDTTEKYNRLKGYMGVQ